MESSDPVQNQVLLYQKYHGMEGVIQFQKFASSKSHPRHFHTIQLSPLEVMSLQAKKLFNHMAPTHIVFQRFCEASPYLFKGRDVLEIGSGFHIEKKLVNLSRSYTGVDPDYPESVEDKSLVDKTDALIAKALSKRERKMIRSKSASWTGLYETSTESGKISLASGFFEEVNIRDKTGFEVIVNNALALNDGNDVKDIRGFTKSGGAYIVMDHPNLLLDREVDVANHFTLVEERWFELKGHRPFKDMLYMMSVYQV